MYNRKPGQMAGSGTLKKMYYHFLLDSLIKIYTAGGKIKKEQSRRKHQGNEFWWDFQFYSI